MMDTATEADGALRLGPVLDLAAAAPLAEALVARRGGAVTIDASDVRRLGGQCLQVLLAAKAQWRVDACRFEVSSTSQSFDENMALFGADLTQASESAE